MALNFASLIFTPAYVCASTDFRDSFQHAKIAKFKNKYDGTNKVFHLFIYSFLSIGYRQTRVQFSRDG